MGRKTPKSMPVQTAAPARFTHARIIFLLVILLGIATFCFTRYYILFELEPQVSDLFAPYFQYAAGDVDLHQIPYTADFQIEYPPLAWWAIRAPRLFDDRQITRPRDPAQVMPIFNSYTHAFRGMMFCFDLISFVIVLLVVYKRNPRLVGWAALVYAISTAILGHLLYDRLDMGMLMLLMLWAFCWVKSLNQSGPTIVWTSAAYAMIGLGISFKIIPVISVPFLLLSEFHASRRWARLSFGLIALAVGVCMPFAVQYAISGPGVFALFEHHAEREIQLESLYSTLMMIVSALGGPAAVVSHSHGAFNLSGDLSHAMKILSTVVLFGFLAILGLWSLLRWSRYGRRDAYCLTCYALSGAVILSNVLSPQYFIWAFPLLIILTAEVYPSAKLMPWIIGALLVAVSAMTTWVFPYHYFYTESNPYGLVSFDHLGELAPSSIGYVVLGLRNFTYLAIILWLGVMLYKKLAPNHGFTQ
jgi:4-amino-4-deoxy-L-arabinose transferase-like glycosyltransferase